VREKKLMIRSMTKPSSFIMIPKKLNLSAEQEESRVISEGSSTVENCDIHEALSR
jgi:hypothetical protein